MHPRQRTDEIAGLSAVPVRVTPIRIVVVMRLKRYGRQERHGRSAR